HPNRIVRANPVIQTIGKQRRLAAINTFDETLHSILPARAEESYIEFPRAKRIVAANRFAV
ncbi:MAG: hypothetical protein ACI8S3_001171, partial [Alphaproteobacteria bacterium]